MGNGWNSASRPNRAQPPNTSKESPKPKNQAAPKTAAQSKPKAVFQPPLSPEEEQRLFGSTLPKGEPVRPQTEKAPSPPLQDPVQQRVYLGTQEVKTKKCKLIWIEGAGCGADAAVLRRFAQQSHFPADMVYLASAMELQGEEAYGRLVAAVNSGEDYILAVSGAIPTWQGGKSCLPARHKGRAVPLQELVATLGERTKHVLAVGNCACYGGITGGRPNLTRCIPVCMVVPKAKVVALPGCPVHPFHLEVVMDCLCHGRPLPLDEENRPLFLSEIFQPDIRGGQRI